MESFPLSVCIRNTDVVNGVFGGTNTLNYRNRFGQMDVVNLTTGFHIEMSGGSRLRVAGVLPLTENGNRLFDSEVIANLTVPY